MTYPPYTKGTYTLTLWEEQRELLRHSPVIPKRWIRERVDCCTSRIELRDLLASSQTPDYVRMHANDRLRELGG